MLTLFSKPSLCSWYRREDDNFISFVNQGLAVLENSYALPPASGGGYFVWLDEAGVKGNISG